MPQSSVWGRLLFILYSSEFISILENKLIGYADDSTLIAVVPSPDNRVTVAESLSRDLIKVSEWCDIYGKKLNESKTKKDLRSHAMNSQSLALTTGGAALKEYNDPVILEVTFDSR